MTSLYYRHADCSFWREPPPDAHTPITDLDAPAIEAALARGWLPRLENGTWRVYTSDDPPADVLLHHLRQERDLALRQTDWTQMPDAEIDPQQRQAWIDYRRALRRLPQEHPDGRNVVWPTQPELNSP